MSSWHSYPSVYALGHMAISELLLDPVIVEEKVDGSQFSFGRFDGDLKLRSKGKDIIPDAPEKMFQKAVDTVMALDLVDGLTYRGEYLSKPKHNALAYERVPKGNVIIFDINTGEEKYLSYEAKRIEAERIGLEIVPLLYSGVVVSAADVLSFLDRQSILGGQKIEGVVLKNYSRFGRDKKALMGKYVSEAYKEVHDKEWKAANPTKSDVIFQLTNMFNTPARWDKAVMHLAEKGEIANSPQDIGKLMVEVKADIKKECADDIKEKLYKWAIDQILRGSIRGLPEWYKKKLLENQFEGVK